MAGARKGRGGQGRGAGAKKSQRKSTPSESVFECSVNEGREKFFICLHCDEGVEEGQDAVQCYSCKSWCHKDGCTSMSEREFAVLCDSKSGMDWICEPCRAGKNSSRSNLEAKIDFLIGLVQSSEKRLDKLESECTGDSLKKAIDQRIDERMEVLLEERLEREKRELNLVITNLEESKKTDKAEKNKEEIENVVKLVKKIHPEIKEGEIEEPIRLGKVNLGQRPRLFACELSCSSLWRHICFSVQIQRQWLRFMIRKNVEKLIESVKKRRAIYDQSLPEHTKDVQLLASLWASVADKLKESIPGADITG